MKNKGVTIVELMIVIVIISIISSLATISVSEILSNSKKSSFVSSAETIVEAAITAHLIDDPIWDGVDQVSLSDIIDSGFIDPLGEAPWGGEYNLEKSYVSFDLITTNEQTSDPVIVLSTSILPLQLGTYQTGNVYKCKLVTTNAVIGYEEALEAFTKDDIYFLNNDNNSLYESIVETFTGGLKTNVTTEEGDDTVDVSGKIHKTAEIETGDGNDTVSASGNIEDNAHVYTGEGNDTVSSGSNISNQAIISTGPGNDNINVENNVADNANIDTGEGNDTITIGGSVRNKAIINMGDGEDTLTISGSIISNTNVNTGNDDDTITVGGSLTTNAILNTGSGNDTVTIDAITRASNINTGSGNDTLRITTIKNNFDGTVSMGSGTDTLYLTSYTEAEWNSTYSEFFSGVEIIHLKDTTINQ